MCVVIWQLVIKTDNSIKVNSIKVGWFYSLQEHRNLGDCQCFKLPIVGSFRNSKKVHQGNDLAFREFIISIQLAFKIFI